MLLDNKISLLLTALEAASNFFNPREFFIGMGLSNEEIDVLLSPDKSIPSMEKEASNFVKNNRTSPKVGIYMYVRRTFAADLDSLGDLNSSSSLEFGTSIDLTEYRENEEYNSLVDDYLVSAETIGANVIEFHQ